MKGKNYKKYSGLVEISSTLQKLRAALLKKGRVLQGLLEVPYPGADAVCSAVGGIHNLLEHDDICNGWVACCIPAKSIRTYWCITLIANGGI